MLVPITTAVAADIVSMSFLRVFQCRALKSRRYVGASLTSDEIIGIGLGGGACVALVVAGVVTFIVCRSKKKHAAINAANVPLEGDYFDLLFDWFNHSLSSISSTK
jgi:hypothetical protein